MTKADFSEYEKRRAENHEIDWRLAASLTNIDSHVCHFRQCRRNRVCVGPMVQSAHQNGQVRAQREIGLSGEACAFLPLCFAQCSDRLYPIARKTVEVVGENRGKDMSDRQLLEAIRLDVAKRHRQRQR